MDGYSKSLAKHIKNKGLKKLRWYCQICQKQCRDENGFRNHCDSESHKRQQSIYSDNPEQYLDEFSTQFTDAFIDTLSKRYGTKRVAANQVYQEIVKDQHHLHMSATKWKTLSEFVEYLGSEGLCKVSTDSLGSSAVLPGSTQTVGGGSMSVLFIEWIDNSPEALEKAAAARRRIKRQQTEAERDQEMLAKQKEMMSSLSNKHFAASSASSASVSTTSTTSALESATIKSDVIDLEDSNIVKQLGIGQRKRQVVRPTKQSQSKQFRIDTDTPEQSAETESITFKPISIKQSLPPKPSGKPAKRGLAALAATELDSNSLETKRQRI